jgi:hypothetical protein
MKKFNNILFVVLFILSIYGLYLFINHKINKFSNEHKKLIKLIKKEKYLKTLLNSNKKFNKYLIIKSHYADKLLKLNTKFSIALAKKEKAEINYYRTKKYILHKK